MSAVLPGFDLRISQRPALRWEAAADTNSPCISQMTRTPAFRTAAAAVAFRPFSGAHRHAQAAGSAALVLKRPLTALPPLLPPARSVPVQLQVHHRPRVGGGGGGRQGGDFRLRAGGARRHCLRRPPGGARDPPALPSIPRCSGVVPLLWRCRSPLITALCPGLSAGRRGVREG